MLGFRDRLNTAIQNSAYLGQMKTLAADVGCGDKTIYNILNNRKLDTSKTGPGFFLMARIAKSLGVSLDHLATDQRASVSLNSRRIGASPLAQQAAGAVIAALEIEGGKPTPDSLLRLHTKSGGQLEAFTALLKFCDRYAAIDPRNPKLEVVEIGERSLSAITMGHANTNVLQEAIANVGEPELAQNWIKDYSEAPMRGTLCTTETLNVQMPNQPTRVKMDFIRCLLRVTSTDDKSYILNFSFLIV